MAFSTFLPMILASKKHENDCLIPDLVSFVPPSILLGLFRVLSHPVNSHSVDFKNRKKEKGRGPDLREYGTRGAGGKESWKSQTKSIHPMFTQ